MAAVDLLLAGARIVTLDPQRPAAEALGVRGDRIVALGSYAELRPLIGPGTEIVDGAGKVVLPAFHDAHCHLLSYARSLSSLDCRKMRSIGEIQSALAREARKLPTGAWIRASGYDDRLLTEARQPDRCDLDAAAPNRAVRLQHRSLHLDVLNSLALSQLGLMAITTPQVERDPRTGQPTGRLYHAADLLRDRMPHQSFAETARDVRLASERLLAWGVTSVQDASVSNGGEEWELFHRLAEEGVLGVRVFVMAGERHWREVEDGQPASAAVRRGPVKFMANESTTDQNELRAAVAAARAAGKSVAIHAVSEAEVAMALDAVGDGEGSAGGGPNRIEHGAVIPDALLEAVRAAGVTVVRQPSLVHERGDAYLAEYPPEQQGWLHRARSLLAAGVPYAIGSDAPVTEPAPALALLSARRRRTGDGALLGPDEALDEGPALEAVTIEPARAAGVGHELGQLRPGALADVVVLDPDVLEEAWFENKPTPSPSPTWGRQASLTITSGRVVWRR